jgi:hypothetical protein
MAKVEELRWARLEAGIFTASLANAMRAAQEPEFGGRS